MTAIRDATDQPPTNIHDAVVQAYDIRFGNGSWANHIDFYHDDIINHHPGIPNQNYINGDSQEQIMDPYLRYDINVLTDPNAPPYQQEHVRQNKMGSTMYLRSRPPCTV
jgi:hypothetical protein